MGIIGWYFLLNSKSLKADFWFVLASIAKVSFIYHFLYKPIAILFKIDSLRF